MAAGIRYLSCNDPSGWGRSRQSLRYLQTVAVTLLTSRYPVFPLGRSEDGIGFIKQKLNTNAVQAASCDNVIQSSEVGLLSPLRPNNIKWLFEIWEWVFWVREQFECGAELIPFYLHVSTSYQVQLCLPSRLELYNDLLVIRARCVGK